MTEVDLTGTNGITFPTLATWHWEVAVYLFLGGLVAGLMVFGGLARLTRRERLARGLWIADLTALPLLGTGLLLLWLDLANRWNAWRFFTTFQVTSAMSWGSWILLCALIVLALRFLGRLPLFTPPAGSGRRGLLARLRGGARAIWNAPVRVGRRAGQPGVVLDILTLGLGTGLGFYTGVLLSTIPARPLWNSAALAPLFLISGLAGGAAFLCLFVPASEHKQLNPFSALLCGVELVLIFAYAVTLHFGSQAAQRAGGLILGGDFSLAFWGIVVLLGLLVPLAIESFDLSGRHIPVLAARIPPVLKLTGGVALRLVIVYAGLQSFV